MDFPHPYHRRHRDGPPRLTGLHHESPHQRYYRIFPRRHARRGQNFIQTCLASIRVTHLDIRTHGNALRPHFNVYVTGSEVNNDEVRLYLRDRDYLTSRFHGTKQGQGATLQLPLPQPMSRRTRQVHRPCYTQVERTKPVSPTQTNLAGQKYPRIPRMRRRYK